MKVPTDRGQRDVDDGDVESHDEEAHRADEQDADASPPIQLVDQGRSRDIHFHSHNGY